MQSETAQRLLERLKQLRIHRKLSQEKFAEEAHFSYKYYQAVEAGRKKDLRLSTLERLAQAHGIEVWRLLMPQGFQEPAVSEPPVTDPAPLKPKARKKNRRPPAR